jgi:DNA polymerase-3 subunit alpha
LLVSTIDKFDAESIGLLKMDVLGLNTMAVIQETKRLIKRNYNIDVDLEEMCRDVTYNGGDKSVYAEFAAGHTTGVFQFTTPGLTRLAMQVKIEKFSEISDCTALHRPSGIHCVSLMVKILRKVLVKCQEEWIEIEEWIKIGEVIGQICKIVVYDSKECMCCPKIGMVHKTGKQKVYKVKTKNGKELVCTEDERFNVGNGEYKKLKDIAIGESIYYI